MELIIKIPDDKKDLIIDTICNRFNYTNNITINVLDPSGNITYDASSGQIITEVVPNISKGAFSKLKIIKNIKDTVKGYIHLKRENEMFSTLKSEMTDIENINIT